MRLKVDKTSDALYFRLDESAIVDSEEVRPGGILDFNEHGQWSGLSFSVSRLGRRRTNSRHYISRQRSLALGACVKSLEREYPRKSGL